jgi:hypothetical protein
MSVPSSNPDIEILPTEEFSYVLVDPGVFRNIGVFSYWRVLVLYLEGGIDNVKVTLVRTGIFDAYHDRRWIGLL